MIHWLGPGSAGRYDANRRIATARITSIALRGALSVGRSRTVSQFHRSMFQSTVRPPAANSQSSGCTSRDADGTSGAARSYTSHVRATSRRTSRRASVQNSPSAANPRAIVSASRASKSAMSCMSAGT